MKRSAFEYDLPPDRIAQHPMEPRDRARLLRTSDLADFTFADLPTLLHRDDVVVLNDTRVRRARLTGRKRDSGGAVELLLLERLRDGYWEAMVKPARRIRPGTELDLGGRRVTVVEPPVDGVVVVAAEFDLDELAEQMGTVPLPPYIHEPLADPADYQTVYARRIGSAAAPTAGLHFTPAVLGGLADRGIEVRSIDLHVGMGTFRPIATDDVSDHVMHRERYEIPEETARAVTTAIEDGRRIVAVGTTVVRALESAWEDGQLRSGVGVTDLFIRPGFRFGVVGALVTNFHVPGSTLVAMVAAFMGDRWRLVYDTALARGYRFLSFGDAMLADR